MKLRRYLEESPIYALNNAYEVLLSHINKVLKKEDVNFLQGLVLTALFFEEGKALTPSKLAEQFQTSRGNMSHIISHLEYKGFVKRVLNEADARQFHIELKPGGKKKALVLIKYFDKLQGAFEKALGAKACQNLSFNIQNLKLIYDQSVMT